MKWEEMLEGNVWLSKASRPEGAVQAADVWDATDGECLAERRRASVVRVLGEMEKTWLERERPGKWRLVVFRGEFFRETVHRVKGRVKVFLDVVFKFEKVRGDDKGRVVGHDRTGKQCGSQADSEGEGAAGD